MIDSFIWLCILSHNSWNKCLDSSFICIQPFEKDNYSNHSAENSSFLISKQHNEQIILWTLSCLDSETRLECKGGNSGHKSQVLRLGQGVLLCMCWSCFDQREIRSVCQLGTELGVQGKAGRIPLLRLSLLLSALGSRHWLQISYFPASLLFPLLQLTSYFFT